MKAIPDLPGAYALCLRLAQEISLSVGRLGQCYFPEGVYLYLGSAHGPGGLRARLGRHLSVGGVRHWHIDYLRTAAEVAGFACVTHEGMAKMDFPLECRWSQSLLGQAGNSAPAPGFGASDCRWDCLAHLVYLGPGEWGLGGWIEI